MYFLKKQIQQELISQGRNRNNSLALAIACYLVQMGCDPEVRNRKGKTAADVVADASVWDCLLSYVQRRNKNKFQPRSAGGTTGAVALEPTNQAQAAETPEEIPSATAEVVLDPIRSEEGKECVVCCEASPDIKFIPCGHTIVCSECAQRMKKCLECHQLITNKVAAGSFHFISLPVYTIIT